MPTWVLSMALALFSMMSFVAGLVLDSVARGRAEQKRIFYLSIPGRRPRRDAQELPRPAGRRGSSRAA
jgi:hypothetical protein